MGSTIDRYIFREMLAPFFLGLGVFTFVLLIARILKLVELVVNRGVPPSQILKLFSYILPAFLEVTVPMALLLAILVALGRLSADSEIVALRANGFSLYQLARPVLVFALLALAATLALSSWVRPWGNRLLKSALYDIAKTRAAVGLRERVFNADFPGLVIYVDRIDGAGSDLRGVLISDTRDPNQHNTVFARRGILLNDEQSHTVTLRLVDGRIETTVPGEEQFNETGFAIYDINLDLAAALAESGSRQRDPKEMTLAELREAIALKQRRGEPAYREAVEVQRKLSVPFACLVFAGLGIPLGIRSARSARSRGFPLSIALIFLYYVLLTVGESLAERGRIPAAVGLWTPNALFGAGAAYLFLAAAQEKAPLALATIESRLANLRARVQSRFTPSVG